MRGWQLPNPANVYWDDWALLLVQAAGLVALIIYVWKTWQMAAATTRAAEASLAAVEESQKARLEALAPRIVVYFDGNEHLSAQIVIYNAGSGTAGDLQLSFAPPLQNSDHPDLLAFFDTPQSVVPPGYRLTQMFDAWPGYFKANLPSRYQVTATYKGLENGKSYTTTHVLDVEGIRHRLVGSEDRSLGDIKRALGEMAHEIRGFKQASENYYAAKVYQNSVLAAPEGGGMLLTRLWRSVQSMDQNSHIREWSGFLDVLRSVAIAALVSRTGAPLTPDQVTALSKASSVLHSIMSEVMGNTGWYAEVDAAMAGVEHAFGDVGLSQGDSDSALGRTSCA